MSVWAQVVSLTGDGEIFRNCFPVAVFEYPDIRVFQFGLEYFVFKLFFFILQVLVIMNIFVNFYQFSLCHG
jgi:hypothetical protein